MDFTLRQVQSVFLKERIVPFNILQFVGKKKYFHEIEHDPPLF